MSLINDALKRASQSEKNRPRDPGSHSAMQPVPESRRSLVPVLLGVWIFILLALAGWFVWRSLLHRGSPQPAVASARQGASVAPAPPPKVEPAPVPAPVPAPQPAPVVVTPPPVVTPAPLPSVASAKEGAPQPQPFPELKLQGIFYNRTNPKAAINGQIRAQNELIGDVRILTITQDKVTVEWNGQTKDLNLGGD
jgi:hypothetical protein